MKTFKYKIFIIVLLLSILGLKNDSFADGGLGTSDRWTLLQFDYTKEEELKNKKGNIVNIINEYMQNVYIGGYINRQTAYTDGIESANPLTTKIVLHTTVTCSKVSGANVYNVIIGNHHVDNMNVGLVSSGNDGVKYTSFEQIRDRLCGPLSEAELESSPQWDITIVATVPYTGQEEGNKKTYKIEVTDVYSGWTSKDEISGTGTVVDIGNPPKTEEEETSVETSDGLAGLWKLLLNILRLVPDLIQMMVNSLQSGWGSVGYTPAALEKIKNEEISAEEQGTVDALAGNVNNYVMYKKGGEGEHKPNQKYIVIPAGITTTDPIDGSTETVNYEFSKDETEIPFISTDLFTLASNKVSYIDANFFEKTGNKSDLWLSLRNIIASIVHATMYVAIGCMMVALIYNGVILVKGSITQNSVNAEMKSRERTQRVFKGFTLLIGTILFEALCIYSNEMFLGYFIDSEDTSLEGPIRVYVEMQEGETGYSFSTTPTGYFRYMSEINNDALVGKKGMYLLWYTITVIANALFLIAMFVRMIIMMGLAAISFFIVVYYLFCKDEEVALRQYKSCMTTYLVFTLIQVALAGVVRIIIDIGIK